MSGGNNVGENFSNKIVRFLFSYEVKGEVLYHKNTVLTHSLYELTTGRDVIQNLTSNGEVS